MSDGLAQTLASLHALLAAEGYIAHADGVEQAHRALEQSQTAVCDQLASNAFWGGPGAVWDIVFSREHIPPTAPTSLAATLRARDENAVNEANRQLASLTIRLADEFAATCANRVHPSWTERASNLRDILQDTQNENS